MKNYSINYIYRGIYNGRINPHIHKMKIKTSSNISYMNYKYYLKQPMQLIERRLILNLAKNPQAINLLKRGSDQPLIRKYIHIPFHD